MTTFSLGSLRNSSVWAVYRMRDQIDLDPSYQRESDIWSTDSKQSLIDTIVNGFDVPKLYMHKLTTPQTVGDRQVELAVIDGKQRLSAIWDFIRGSFTLANDFTYVKDDTVLAANFTYADLAREYPEIKADFDAYGLDIVTIETEDTDIIEDMFSRLNEAVPLNAAEKRNAWRGPLPRAVRQIAQHPFFHLKIPFSNRRYRHFDLSAKFLYHSHHRGPADTKKAYIDHFFRSNQDSDDQDLAGTVQSCLATLDAMESIFTDTDPMLRSVGMITLYFLALQKAIELDIAAIITRPALADFEFERRRNREVAAADIASANYDLLEFDRYTQSPNDAVALRFRLSVLDRLSFGGQLETSD